MTVDAQQLLREDGRTDNQIRAVGAEYGLLNQADGSARYSHQKSSALAAVYGPSEVKRSAELMDRASLEVIVKPHIGLPTTRHAEYGSILRSTLENDVLATLHPRTAISVVIQVVNDDGSMLAVMLNAAVLALIDAGVPMKSLLVSICCAVIRTPISAPDMNVAETEEEEYRIVLDPSLCEEKVCVLVQCDAQDSMLASARSPLTAPIHSFQASIATAMFAYGVSDTQKKTDGDDSKVAAAPKSDAISMVSCHSEGRFPIVEGDDEVDGLFFDCLSLSKQSASTMFQFFRGSLIKKVERQQLNIFKS
eukprot:TRINITY_DN1698_c0_g1_i1.p1 TRINITY_DN1698_c0_g1~~TRINITY_DN1698_c0_g1_i1.p1  ORF type:complete len:307 (-),score=77.11 TRINITY_DN1698_c0_g1_i1:117-1037(-)